MLDVIVISPSRKVATRLKIEPRRVVRGHYEAKYRARIIWSNDPDVLHYMYQRADVYVTDEVFYRLQTGAQWRFPVDGTSGPPLISHVARVLGEAAGLVPLQTIVLFGKLRVRQGFDGKPYLEYVPESGEGYYIWMIDPPTAQSLFGYVTEFAPEVMISVIGTKNYLFTLDPVVYARKDFFMIEHAVLDEVELPGLGVRLRLVLGRIVPGGRQPDGRVFVKFIEYLPADLFRRLSSSIRLVLSLARLDDETKLKLLSSMDDRVVEAIRAMGDSIDYWRRRAVTAEHVLENTLQELERVDEIAAMFARRYVESYMRRYEVEEGIELAPFLAEEIERVAVPRRRPVPEAKPEAKAEAKSESGISPEQIRVIEEEKKR